jgi:cytochrome c oxidase assembly protein Cox11
MHPFLRFFLYSCLFLFVANFLLSKYNNLCLDRWQCSPIFPSFYARQIFNPSSDTTAEINFSATSYNPNIKFFPGREKIIAETNHIYLQDFYLINTSNNKIKTPIGFNIKTTENKNNIITYRCLCNSSYTLQPKEKRIIRMAYQVSDNESINKNKVYKINYYIPQPTNDD